MAAALSRLGYRVVRQWFAPTAGMRLPHPPRDHGPRACLLKIGLLAAILNEVAAHRNLGREELRRLLFG